MAVCMVWCESGECATSFLALQWVLEILQSHPRSHLGGLPVWGLCIYLNSCVRKGCFCVPFLPVLRPWLSALALPAQRHWTSICFLPLPSASLGWPRHAARAASLWPAACHMLAFFVTSLAQWFPSPLLTPWHSSRGSLATPGISSLAQSLVLAAGCSAALGLSAGKRRMGQNPIPRFRAEIINRDASQPPAEKVFHLVCV